MVPANYPTAGALAPTTREQQRGVEREIDLQQQLQRQAVQHAQEKATLRLQQSKAVEGKIRVHKDEAVVLRRQLAEANARIRGLEQGEKGGGKDGGRGSGGLSGSRGSGGLSGSRNSFSFDEVEGGGGGCEEEGVVVAMQQ